MDSISLKKLFPLRHAAGIAATYTQTIKELEIEGMGIFPALLLSIWQLRDQDLQKKYPLNTLSSRLDFMAWCVVCGGKEYKALRELKIFWEGLSDAAPVQFSFWSGGISRFLKLAIVYRKDLGIDAELADEESQIAALNWFWFKGGWQDFDPKLLCFGLYQEKFFFNHPDILRTRFAILLYRNRPDLQEIFDITTSKGRDGLRTWILDQGTKETNLALLAKFLKKENNKNLNSHGILIEKTQPPFGVNLIGYAFGDLGIGEDVRMAAHACKAADIPFCVINFQPGIHISQNDKSISSWVVEEPKYSINIFCLTALENLRFFLENGSYIFKNRRNIGYWPWELEYWPANWEHCFNLIDEAWASSTHIAKAMRRVSHVPVRLMPMAVKIPHNISLSKFEIRRKFGLPNNKILFVFSFDGKSSVARKNPVGVVKAFLLAFSKENKNVGLVIKCIRPDNNDESWLKILNIANLDKRIIIIDSNLTKTEVLELYFSCDVFISLHRAEGFGRGIAEALLLGLDVIATNYGGNTDFCHPCGAYMIPFSVKSVSSNEYIEGDGNQWAEPHIDQAAIAMRSIAKSAPNSNSILSQLLFSPLTAGTRYKKVLNQLDN